ncbi:MAG: hypothetical protein ACKVWR_20815 [Acidimicrobiales bacterium]
MSLPLGVSLRIDGEPALYSGPGRDGLLRLSNDGTAPLVLAARTPEPSASDHHVALHLPAGTLSPSSLADLRAADPWRATAIADARSRGGNRWDAVYLSCQEPLLVAPGDDVVVELRGLSALPGGRAQTTRLVVEYNLEDPANPPAGPSAAARSLTGARSVPLHVVPWQHNPAHLHLMAAVRRGAEVLNLGGVTNTIEIRLAADVVLGAIELVGGQTELILSWDVGPAEDRWWALCSAAEANAATVSLSWSFADDRPAPEPILDEDVWVSPTAATWGVTLPQDVSLRQGDHVAIVVSGLLTAHPAGPANLYLDVVGVGDGDGGAVSGSFVLPVHKQAHRWSDGGLVAMGGVEGPLLDLRNEFAEPALKVAHDGAGHTLELFVAAEGTPERSVGARIRGDGDAFLGGGLHLRGPLSVGGDGGTVALDHRRDDGSPNGRLRLEGPDDAEDYVVGVRSGRLVTADVDVHGALTVEGFPPVAIGRHRVAVFGVTETAMDTGWDAVLISAPAVELDVRGEALTVGFALRQETRGWVLAPTVDVFHDVDGDGPVDLSATTEATVLYIRRALLGWSV